MRDGKSCANYIVPSLFLAGFRTGCLQSGSQCLGKTLLIDQQKVQVIFVAVDSSRGCYFRMWSQLPDFLGMERQMCVASTSAVYG